MLAGLSTLQRYNLKNGLSSISGYFFKISFVGWSEMQNVWTGEAMRAKAWFFLCGRGVFLLYGGGHHYGYYRLQFLKCPTETCFLEVILLYIIIIIYSSIEILLHSFFFLGILQNNRNCNL